MSYTRVNWNSTTTYVSADNLNIMDKGIKDLDTNIGDVTTLTTTAKTVVPAIKELKTGLEALNNNLQLIDFTGTTLSYSHINGMSMLELPSIPNKNIVAIYPCMRTDGLTYNGFFVNDWGACLALLTDGKNNAINSTVVSLKILAL